MQQQFSDSQSFFKTEFKTRQKKKKTKIRHRIPYSVHARIVPGMAAASAPAVLHRDSPRCPAWLHFSSQPRLALSSEIISHSPLELLLGYRTAGSVPLTDLNLISHVFNHSLLISYLLFSLMGLLGGSVVKNPWVWSLGGEDPLEKKMSTHSSIPAWRVPWTEEPGRLQSMGSQPVRHNRATCTSLIAAFFMVHFIEFTQFTKHFHISLNSQKLLGSAYAGLKEKKTEIQEDGLWPKLYVFSEQGSTTWLPEMSWVDPDHSSRPGWDHSRAYSSFQWEERLGEGKCRRRKEYYYIH